MMDRHEERRHRLKAALVSEGLDACLVSGAASRYYLSGFELHDPQPDESAGRIVVTADGPDYLCTDSRYAEAAYRVWDRRDVLIYAADPAAEMAGYLAGRIRGRLGFDENGVSVGWWRRFSSGLTGVECVHCGDPVARLRVVKDADEIARMRASCRLNERMMRWLPGVLERESPLTEAALAWRIETFFRENGASGLAFDTIAAFGPNAALPHAIPGDTVIRGDGPLLVDAGCRLAGYCSDQTRVFWVGERPSAVFSSTLERVREAQRRAIAAIRPGARCRDVARVAVDCFEEQGCAAYFTHALGHGVGLETHEAVSLSLRSEAVLQPGMVVTVEPGLYYNDWGGVRWEHMVLVTEDGCEVL